ncbi:sensor histidine kinase [Thermodesulfobacteriota bacterium]
MTFRFSLFSKILVTFFINLVLIGLFLAFSFNLRFRLAPESPLRGETGDRLRTVERLISQELNESSQDKWDSILARYSDAYAVGFLLLSPSGHWIAGEAVAIPPVVEEKIAEMGRPRPRQLNRRHPPREMIQDGILSDRPPGTEGDQEGHGHRPPPPHHDGRHGRFTVRSSDPTRYWACIRTAILFHGAPPPRPALLLAVSDSMTGNGLFMDPKPWLIVAGIVVLLSGLLWAPLLRSLTRRISRMTTATEEIGRGHFDVRVDERQTDDIGRLGKAINEMAFRLSRYVEGQKRFLGDVAHELASPVARIQVGLGILEQRVDEGNRERVQDVIEEVGHMSDLISELLSFTRAEIEPARAELKSVAAADIIQRAVEREVTENIEIGIEVDEDLVVVADPELLARALGNLIRNAIRYAGESGPIDISTRRKGKNAAIEVRDSGPGVPEAELDRLFEPFYRPEASRGADTGGVGMGLAIVKTCAEACHGSVSARNIEPRGFVVTIVLDTPN